jgi:hypothetical protein
MTEILGTIRCCRLGGLISGATDTRETVDANEKYMNTEKRGNSGYETGTWPIMGMRRRVRVKGMAGIDATVIVTAVREKVWLSISPPFTWEAIMEPRKVDEVISALELARDEVVKMAATRK